MAPPEPDDLSRTDGLITGGGAGLRQLVLQAQAGDRKALEKLFERHEPMMLRWARRRLGVPLRTLDETRDVLHDAYQVVLRKLTSFRMEDSRSFARWLRGIITRVVLQKSGSQHLKRRRELPDEPGVVSPDLTPMTRLSIEELERRRFRILLTEFDRTDRKIYRLRTRGTSAAEIAAMLGVTDRAVRMRFAKTDARIRMRMQQVVEAPGDGR